MRSTCTASVLTSFCSLTQVGRLARPLSLPAELFVPILSRHQLQALPSTMGAAAEVSQGGLRALRRGERNYCRAIDSQTDLTPTAPGLPHRQDAIAIGGGSRAR